MLDRKSLKSKIAWFSIFLLLSSSLLTISPFSQNKVYAYSKTYYVSTTRYDNNNGSISSPFRTLAKARDIVRTFNGNMTDDIKVYFRQGTYDFDSTVTFDPRDSGTNGHKVYYESYTNETATFTGGVKVSGTWTQNGNI